MQTTEKQCKNQKLTFKSVVKHKTLKISKMQKIFENKENMP